MWLFVGLAAMALAPVAARADVCNEDIALCGPGETPASCPTDCGGCGDLRCDPHENAVACPEDCGPCGNLRCEPGETLSCPDDCSITICGDLVCAAGEAGCAVDCGAAACANGIDDDGDALIDFPADPGCQTPGSSVEDPKCDDDDDNDNDGKIDWDGGPLAVTPDPQCANRPWRNQEGVTCGLGAELALLMPSLLWLRRRRVAVT